MHADSPRILSCIESPVILLLYTAWTTKAWRSLFSILSSVPHPRWPNGTLASKVVILASQQEGFLPYKRTVVTVRRRYFNPSTWYCTSNNSFRPFILVLETRNTRLRQIMLRWLIAARVTLPRVFVAKTQDYSIRFSFAYTRRLTCLPYICPTLHESRLGIKDLSGIHMCRGLIQTLSPLTMNFSVMEYT